MRFKVFYLVMILGSTLLLGNTHLPTVTQEAYRSWERDHELGDRASHILIGQVNSVDSRWNDDQTLIYSYVKVLVEHCLKGDYPGEEVVIRVIGGEVGNTGLKVSEEPSFVEGEKVKVFLKLDVNGEFAAVGGKRGKISLSNAEPLSPGFSYYGVRWADSDIPVKYYINQDGTPDTTDEFTAVQNSFQTWEDDSGSYIDYTYLGKTSLSGPSDNSVNVVSWQSIDGVGNVIALCYLWYDAGTSLFYGIDIVFDEDEAWSTTGDPSKLDVQNVGTHEVGHTLALDDLYDIADSEETMYGYSGLGETKQRTLFQGDIAGVRFIYPEPDLGPAADSLLVQMYMNPDAQCEAFDTSNLDMVDGPTATWWFDRFALDRMHPLTEYWITRWTGNPDITMRAYAEGGKVCFDLNNQRWPTGVTLPRIEDPVTETYKHYSNYADAKEQKARDFRRALACLSDKDGYISHILKGLAYRMDTTVPDPCLAGYVNRAVSGGNYPYNFDPWAAAGWLNGAGFTQGTTPNPYYPASPEGWEAQYIRIDPAGDWSQTGLPGGNLKPLLFYTRLDDPQRTDAAQELTDMMRKSGIMVDLKVVEKAECVTQVKELYDYHIYTGGWTMDVYPTWVYFMYASDMYWGGTIDSYYGGIECSPNYVGYCSVDYTAEALTALTTTDHDVMKTAVLNTQAIYVNDCPVIDLWAAAAVGAHKSKWSCIVNMEEFGIANHWSFFTMHNEVGDTTIDLGIDNPLINPHVASAGLVCDRGIVDLMYEGLIGLNPYNYAMGEEVGTTADFENPLTVGEWAEGTLSKVTYHLRLDVTFHSGKPMTPYDAAFSLIFLRDCGQGVYWNYGAAGHIQYIALNPMWVPGVAEPGFHLDIVADPNLPEFDMAVYFNVKSMWAPYWGSHYVLDSDLWLAADAKYGWGFGTLLFDRFAVRDYRPWEMDANDNGVMDMYEDGTGAWMLSGHSGGAVEGWTWVSFEAFRQHYWTQSFVNDFKIVTFHKECGNVNYEGSVWEAVYAAKPHGLDMITDLIDGFYISRAYGTTPEWPNGTDFSQWNEDCDFDDSGNVYASDLYVWGSNYGREK